MLESGRQYCAHSKTFVSGVQELSQNSPGDAMMSECLEKFSKSLTKMIEGHEQEKEPKKDRSFKERCDKDQDIGEEWDLDMKQFKETRKEFERGSESLASALHHNAEVPRRRHHEAEEAMINVIQSKKKSEILKFMLTLMEAQSSYLEEGFHMAKQLEQYRKDLAAQLHQLVLESAREKRDMEQRHTAIKQKDLSRDDVIPESRTEPGGVVMEGYLYKRASNAFKTWSRSCLLQADSERHQQAWVCAVQNSIASAYNEERLESPGQPLERTASLSAAMLQSPSSRKLRGGVDKHVVDQVQRLEGNAQCCDCREPAPEWASINLGITLCIECSGIHRAEKEAWIRAKYVEKKFITKFPKAGLRINRGGDSGGQYPESSKPHPSLHPGALLYRAAAAPPSLPTMADALAHGADVNWVNVTHESRTPLLQAVEAVSLG
ncbi:hypothetical protein JD844_000819 [Phrynosoma platyrhinos]|uniref:Arf-GAP with coiled-coil, ANK repeat and PH domain-containing protein n=1 Tax=Phrynosoma platyrhinos TaxID=52577 RepID=A0ABQ7T9G6_PHRPL|nr:hypothetical protein JD844_000819 [Phrynosoma platyrhinos]